MEKMIFPSVSIFYAVKQELLDLTVVHIYLLKMDVTSF